MGTQGAGRRRSTKKDKSTAEDDALNLIAREAEARLAAKRAARAEAREIRMKELERQQKELSDDDERMSAGSRGSVRVDDRDFLEKGSRAASALTAGTLTSSAGTSSRRGSVESALTVDAETSIREIKETLSQVEEKYRKAMVSNAQLDNEKNNLMYQVDTLKDSLMELEELLSESRREFQEKVKDFEREKHAHGLLQFQFQEMKETLKQSEELLNKHGIVLGPDLTVNGDIGEAEVDGMPGGDAGRPAAQEQQASPAEGNSMLGDSEETLLRPCGEEAADPEQRDQIAKEEVKGKLKRRQPHGHFTEELPSKEPRLRLPTEESICQRPITEDAVVVETSAEENSRDVAESNIPDLVEAEVKGSHVDLGQTCSQIPQRRDVIEEKVEEPRLAKEESSAGPEVAEDAAKDGVSEPQPEKSEEETSTHSQADSGKRKKKKKKRGKRKGNQQRDGEEKEDVKTREALEPARRGKKVVAVAEILEETKADPRKAQEDKEQPGEPKETLTREEEEKASTDPEDKNVETVEEEIKVQEVGTETTKDEREEEVEPTSPAESRTSGATETSIGPEIDPVVDCGGSSEPGDLKTEGSDLQQDTEPEESQPPGNRDEDDGESESRSNPGSKDLAESEPPSDPPAVQQEALEEDPEEEHEESAPLPSRRGDDSEWKPEGPGEEELKETPGETRSFQNPEDLNTKSDSEEPSSQSNSEINRGDQEPPRGESEVSSSSERQVHKSDQDGEEAAPPTQQEEVEGEDKEGHSFEFDEADVEKAEDLEEDALEEAEEALMEDSSEDQQTGSGECKQEVYSDSNPQDKQSSSGHVGEVGVENVNQEVAAAAAAVEEGGGAAVEPPVHGEPLVSPKGSEAGSADADLAPAKKNGKRGKGRGKEDCKMS